MSEILKVVSENNTFSIEFLNQEKTKGKINGQYFEWDICKVSNLEYHAIYNYASYRIFIVNFDTTSKIITLKINQNTYSFTVKDSMEQLLESMGLNLKNSNIVKDIKSPMPGLVIQILVQENQPVKKGDALLILEAMKMENIIKSPGDGVVKKVLATQGKAVEKNELLIQFN